MQADAAANNQQWCNACLLLTVGPLLCLCCRVAVLQDQIAALGPWGGALFVLTVMCAEMVPLFPTQPLTLASGLLFGPVKVRRTQEQQQQQTDRQRAADRHGAVGGCRCTSLQCWGQTCSRHALVRASVSLCPHTYTHPICLPACLLPCLQRQGALFVVLGVTLAAVNAYSLARGVGKQLAQKVIASEMSGEESEGGGPVAKQLAAVTAAIEAGGFMRQVTAITLLRLTPVVPFR